MKKRILALSVLVVVGLTGTAYASQDKVLPLKDKGESTTHLVFCQETGNGWKIVKGDDPSDNKNRVQVGTWDEHARGEGWNAKKASDEFLSQCPKPVEETCASPKVVIKERCVTPVECPAGTTIVDYKDDYRQDPICKGNPTGCPYGDSIPLDSPKCAPSDEVENTTDTPVSSEETEVFYGK